MKKNKKLMIKKLSLILHNFLLIVVIIVLILLVITICILENSNIWNKILACCYIVAITALIGILGLPKSEKKIKFESMGPISFLLWCVIVPIILGLAIATGIKSKVPSIVIDDWGFWLVTISITIISFVWFLTKLYKKKETYSYLDMYSTIWIAFVTVITTLFDLQNKKGAFVFLLSMYFILQILIKIEICRAGEKINK